MEDKPTRKRPTQVVMDLQEYKQPWLEWCASRNVTPSKAFREIIAKLTGRIGEGEGRAIAPVAPPVGPCRVIHSAPENPKARYEVRLTPSEKTLVEAIATAEGFGVPKWIVALIRARLTRTAQLGQKELELLARSNINLLAIGRNLNQLAKALNTSEQARVLYRVELIEELEGIIKSHTKIVSETMTANVERWRIE